MLRSHTYIILTLLYTMHLYMLQLAYIYPATDSLLSITQCYLPYIYITLKYFLLPTNNFTFVKNNVLTASLHIIKIL